MGPCCVGAEVAAEVRADPAADDSGVLLALRTD